VYRAAISLALVLAALLQPGAAVARSGEITNMSGAVVARGADGVSRVVSVKSVVNEGDLLLTAENSYVRVKFTDGAEVVLRPNSQLKIDAYRFDEKAPAGDGALLSLFKGGLRSITGVLARRNPERMNFAVPTATIGIRGTHFGALFCSNDCANVPSPAGGSPENGLHMDVADGRIVVTTQGGAREFAVGQFGFVASPIAAPVLVPANRGVRVVLPPQASSTSVPGSRGVGKAGELECGI
jgi:hypothetical protein